MSHPKETLRPRSTHVGREGCLGGQKAGLGGQTAGHWNTAAHPNGRSGRVRPSRLRAGFRLTRPVRSRARGRSRSRAPRFHRRFGVALPEGSRSRGSGESSARRRTAGHGRSRIARARSGCVRHFAVGRQAALRVQLALHLRYLRGRASFTWWSCAGVDCGTRSRCLRTASVESGYIIGSSSLAHCDGTVGVTAGPRSYSRMRYTDPRVFRALEMKRISRIRRVVAALGPFDSYSSATRTPKPPA